MALEGDPGSGAAAATGAANVGTIGAVLGSCKLDGLVAARLFRPTDSEPAVDALLNPLDKSNLGYEENAILFGRTVGRLALVSEDLIVTCVVGAEPVSIGMTLGPDLPSRELILNGRFVPPDDRGAARLVSFNGDSLAKQGVKLS